MISPLVPLTESPRFVPSPAQVTATRETFSSGEALLWQFVGGELALSLRDLYALQAQVQAAILAELGEVLDRGEYEPQTRTAAQWLSQQVHLDLRDAKATVALADALRTSHARVTAAMTAGALSQAHAQLIVAAVEALPAHATDADRDEAERVLVESAADLTPRELRQASRALHEAIASRAPDVDDPAEAERLAREQAAAEHRALDQRVFTMRQRTDGAWDGRLRLPADAGASVQAALESLAGLPRTPAGEDADQQPRVPDNTEHAIRDDRTKAEKMADALHELCAQVLDSGELPEEGGERPHMHVTVRWETLVGLAEQLTPAAGLFDVGGTLGIAETRRMLCDAQIIPVVLGGAGEVLDIGRATRVWTTAQRRAVAARDGGCVFPGCYKPIRATQVHHMHHWSKGGPTSVDNGALLCLAHHRRVHLQGWEMRLGRNGLPELIPPPSLDPTQRPRQHERFRIRRLGT
jgi:hypothetical protein